MRRHIVSLLLALLALLSAPVAALPTFSDFEASLEVESWAGTPGTRVHLLAGGPFGAGGIGHGMVDFGEVAGPAEILWLVQDELGFRPRDRSRILTFSFDDAGRFMGIEPTPFRVFLSEYPPDPVFPPEPVAPATVIGELDFSGVTHAALGSLTDITGLQLVDRSDGGPALTFAPFTIVAVPEPPLTVLTGLALLAAARLARRSSAART